MSLLDRYVDAVSRGLPRAQRQDIAAELRDVLLSQLEAEQAARGRPPTEDEIADILKRYGAPEVVASRYRASEKHLIGPAAFGHYAFAVKVMLAILVPLMALALCYSAFGDGATVSGVALTFWTWCTILLLNLAVLTLVYARLDRLQAFHAPRDWDPRALVPPRDRDVVSRPEAAFGLVIAIVMLLWWLGLLPFVQHWYGANIRFAPFDIDWFEIAVPFHLAPVWDSLRIPIIALLALDGVLQALHVWRPRVTRWRAGAEVMGDLAGLAILFRVILADQIVVVSESYARWPEALAPLVGPASLGLQVGVRLGLLALAVLAVINIVQNVRRIAGPRVATA